MPQNYWGWEKKSRNERKGNYIDSKLLDILKGSSFLYWNKTYIGMIVAKENI